MFVPSTRSNPARNALRFIAWKLGDLIADAISIARGFRVPDDAIQPYAQKIPMLLGYYEADTKALMRKVIRPGDVIVDGGAHAGYYTRFFSRVAGPSGRVIAFEAHPETERCLRRNMAKFNNVEIVGCALGAENGQATLYERPTASAGNSISVHKPGLQPGFTVPVRTLPSILAELGYSRFDFLKLDIEGTEPEVLATLDEIGGLSDFSAIFEIKRYILEAANIDPEALLLGFLEKGFNIVLDDGGEVTLSDLAKPNARLDKANVLMMKGSALRRWSE